MIRKMYEYLKTRPYHSFCVGLGALLTGLGACIALWQTGGILDRIMQIQTTSNQINNSISELAKAVASLESERKSKRANEVASHITFAYERKAEKLNESGDLLQERDEVLKHPSLKQLLPDEHSNLKSRDIYLPSEAMVKLESKLKSQDWGDDLNAERFLKENLQIWNPDTVKN